MKKVLLILSLILIFLGSEGQTRTDVKIYGYMQPVSRGVHPETTIDESGNATTVKTKPASNYFIYLSGPLSVRIYPVEIWLRGEKYAATPETVNKTPVQIPNPAMPDGKDYITLVPKTSNKIIRLIPGRAVIAGKGLAMAKSKSKTNELVVVYKMNGKVYYSLLEKLNLIERGDMQ